MLDIYKEEYDIQYKANSFNNYYINIFNLLLLLDIDKSMEDDESCYLIYTGDKIIMIPSNDFKIIYDKNLLYNIIGASDTVFTKVNDIDYYNAAIHIIRISKATYNILIKSNILTYNFKEHYNTISEEINRITLEAQRKLTKYIRSYINKKHSIIELLKEMVLDYKGLNDDKFYYKVQYNGKIYHLNNYNNIYRYFCLNNLLITSLYIKYITLLQGAPQNLQQIQQSTNQTALKDIEFIKEIFNNITSTPNEFAIKLDHIIDRYKGYDSDDLYRLLNFNMDCAHDILNLDGYQGAFNALYNIYSNSFIINKITKKDLINIAAPVFENLSNKKLTRPLSKLLKNLHMLEYITNSNIELYKDANDHNYDSNYGEVLLLSNIDSISNVSYYDNDYNNQDDKLLGASVFQGHIQNHNTAFDDNDARYLSNVWIRPLFRNELYTNGTLHSTIKRYNYFRDNLYKNMTMERVYNNISHIHQEDPYYMDSKFIYQSREETINKYTANLNAYGYLSNIHYTNLKIINNLRYKIKNTIWLLSKNNDYKFSNHNVIYKTALATSILIRMYMIGILEYISRTINTSHLLKIETEDDRKLYKNYYSYDIIKYENLIKDFNKLSIFKVYLDDNDIETYNAQYMITFDNPRSRYIYDKKISLNYLGKCAKFRSTKYKFINSFTDYINSALKLNKQLLIKLSTIAKEDIISCADQ